MRLIGAALAGVAYLAVSAACAEPGEIPEAAQMAEIVFLGEQHDNPQHHETQTDWVAQLSPKALVFEMLTSEQAQAVTDENRIDAELLEAALGWNASGWPEFEMYHPIFAAAPEALIFGAGVPRARVQGLMEEPLSAIAEAHDVARFGLDDPLPADEQAARIALQSAAHCDALPEEMLPRMVNVQRLRDAALAGAALAALEASGGPVVVITGNGHARSDWGAPALLARAAPEILVFSLGQSEAGALAGAGFDAVADAPAVERGDPCDAFR